MAMLAMLMRYDDTIDAMLIAATCCRHASDATLAAAALPDYAATALLLR